MFITKELLFYLNACDKGIKLFDKCYPNGVEAVKVLENKKLSFEIFHWGKNKLPLSLEEIEQYYKACKVFNSSEVDNSDNVEDSSYISHSSCINNSKNILQSKNVFNSSIVSYSNEVLDSKAVVKSSLITQSQNVANSSRCVNTINVLNSNIIRDSNNIAFSEEIFYSSFLVKSINSRDCHFGNFLINCKNCLFSSNLSNKSFQLFNHDINENLFNDIQKTYLNKIKNEHLFLINFDYAENENFLTADKLINFNEYFLYLSTEFKDWVKTLPYYDPFIMYRITFDESWLQ